MKAGKNVLLTALLTGITTAIVLINRLQAERPRVTDQPTALASQAWTILTTVESQALEPGPRPRLLLGGMTAFLAEANKVYPATALESRAKQITNESQLKALLEEVWPGNADADAAAKLEAAFLEGLLGQVPGGANWLRPAELKINEQISNNRYVGTGIQIAVNDKEHVTQIPIPFPGGPARKAGVKPNDLLLAVDGKSTRDVPLVKIVEWLRGAAGTSVTMTVRQPDSAEERTLTMVRHEVPFETVQGFVRGADDSFRYQMDANDAIGYIRIKSIKSSTLHELRALVRRLREEGVRALVIDLRFADGGGDLLQHAALTADGLLDHGVLWRTRDKQKQVKEVRADSECLFRQWPLAVLVNADTHGTSMNALAAALQDNGRAVLVGEPTDYTGYVTNQVPLPNDQGALTLRTLQLERASDCGWPVLPDAPVVISKKERDAIREWLRRKDLPASAAVEPAPADRQLAKAVQLVREQLEAKKS